MILKLIRWYLGKRNLVIAKSKRLEKLEKAVGYLVGFTRQSGYLNNPSNPGKVYHARDKIREMTKGIRRHARKIRLELEI